MNIFKTALRSLRYYWKSSLAVSAGFAVAIAALTGSLLVGNSVKRNLQELALGRLANVAAVVRTHSFFTENFTTAIRKNPGDEAFSQPALVLSAAVTAPDNGLIIPEVNILGVTGSVLKYALGAKVQAPEGREVYLSENLIRDLRVKPGDFLVIKINKSGAAPVETLFGQKELSENLSSFSVKVKGVILPEKAGNFNLKNENVKPLNIYISLAALQKELKKEQKINTVFISKPEYDVDLIKDSLTLQDLGLTLKMEERTAYLENNELVFTRSVLEAAKKSADTAGLTYEAASVYILNSINGRAPYSVIGGVKELLKDEIILSNWAAEDTGAKAGDKVFTEYLELTYGGEYIKKTKEFTVKGVLATEVMLKLVKPPSFEGITDARSISGWKTPFPVDMRKIRSKDELYWEKYKTAPKALISLEDAKSFWPKQYTGVTSVKINLSADKDINSFTKYFLRNFKFSDTGIRVVSLREEALKSAQGSTDYSMLFISLSFILVLSALWLTAFLFRLLLEARSSQAGIFLTVGFSIRKVFFVYLIEGGLIIVIGCLISMPISIYYAEFILNFLKPLLGKSTEFKLYIEAKEILTGLLSGILLSFASILFGVLMFKKISVRSLLGKQFLAPAKTGSKPRVKGFFSLALRSLQYSGKRSYLTLGLFAAAAFIIIMTAVNRPESFRFNTLDKNSGSGGYNLIAKSALPLFGDLNTPAGRKNNGITSFDTSVWNDVKFAGCRLSGEGEDISCLNINQPSLPKVLGLPDEVMNEKGFIFSKYKEFGGGKTPWFGLNVKEENGVFPAYADANSLVWILHKKIGDEILLSGEKKLAVKGTLSQSIFAETLLVSEENFVKLYGSKGGHNYFLIRTKEGKEEEVAAELRKELGSAGYTVTKTSELLAAFAGVQNTYLFTFQILGGIGFLLGTFGIIAVLLQNVYERRQQFALKSALGFSRGFLIRLIIFENSLLLVVGLILGTLLAVAVSLPYKISMHNPVNLTLPILTLLGMLVLGLLSCSITAYYSIRGNLVSALRFE